MQTNSQSCYLWEPVAARILAVAVGRSSPGLVGPVGNIVVVVDLDTEEVDPAGSTFAGAVQNIL